MIVELRATGAGEPLLFDVEDGGRKVAVGRGDAVVTAERSVDEAVGHARRTAGKLLEIVAEQDVAEAELRFGLKLTGEAGLFAIAKAGGEAHCEVVLKWKRRD